MSASIASILPARMPISRLARSFWPGSSSSPPLMTRSNLSSGPIAARTARLIVPTAKAAPIPATKRRRACKLMKSPPAPRLQRLDVCRGRALLPLRDVERDLLALFQGFEARALDRAVMGEQILSAVIRRDESEALGVVEPLHCACRHVVQFPQIVWNPAAANVSTSEANRARPTPARGRSPWEDRAPTCPRRAWWRSEEHTSELQSLTNLVCRLLLEKKKKNKKTKHKKTTTII